MRAFFHPGLASVQEGDTVKLPERESEHLFRTLRAKTGEHAELLDGAGSLAEAVVTGRDTLRIVSKKIFPAPSVSVRIYTAVPKGSLLPALLTSLVEAGAAAVIPVNFARSVAKPEAPNERWRMRLIEGCKQSRNLFMPELGKVLSPQEMIADAAANDHAGYFGAIGGTIDLSAPVPAKCALAIGPEGGFTGEEVEMMLAAGWRGISFSPNVLRLETAAVTGCAILRLLAGDS